MKPRLLAVASHPIQYHIPLYRRLACSQQLDVRVAYCREYGLRPTYDRQFSHHIQWDADILAGYNYVFLRSISPIKNTFNPLHAINPGVISEVINWADVIWINGLIYPTNWLAIAAAKLKHIPILLRAELYPTEIAGKSLKIRSKRNFYRHALPLIDRCLTIGTLNQTAYETLGVNQTRMTEARYVVEMDRFCVSERERLERRAKQRAAWGLNDRDVAVLYLGKLTGRKHPEALLALDRAKEAERLALIWVGAGEMEMALKTKAAQLQRAKTLFPGLATQSQVPDVLWAADIFVFPSEREPWGLVLNEAMAAGLPSIVSDQVSAAADLCIEGITCCLYPAEDIEALIGAVDRLVADAPLRVRMGSAARKRIAGWSPEAAASGVEQAALAAFAAKGRKKS